MEVSELYDFREKIKSLQERFNNCKWNEHHEPSTSFKIPWCLRIIIWFLATGTWDFSVLWTYNIVIPTSLQSFGVDEK